MFEGEALPAGIAGLACERPVVAHVGRLNRVAAKAAAMPQEAS
jgi:hypothetical protein